MSIKFDENDYSQILTQKAFVTGFKNNTIRLKLKKGDTAFLTLTYSSDMNTKLQQLLAYRIAGLWNMQGQIQ